MSNTAGESSKIEDLTRIENIVGVELPFDLAHQVHRRAVLKFEQVLVTEADTMFAGNRAAQFDGFANNPVAQLESRLPFLGVLTSGQDQGVQQTESDMAEGVNGQADLTRRLVTELNHLRQP